jgi:hypothetical protein
MEMFKACTDGRMEIRMIWAFKQGRKTIIPEIPVLAKQFAEAHGCMMYDECPYHNEVFEMKDFKNMALYQDHAYVKCPANLMIPSRKRRGRIPTFGSDRIEEGVIKVPEPKNKGINAERHMTIKRQRGEAEPPLPKEMRDIEKENKKSRAEIINDILDML